MEEEREMVCCAHCGEEFELDEVYEMEEELYCLDCLDELTVVCSDCGKRIWSQNNFGNEDAPLCEYCYNNHYTICEECGRTIHLDDAYYIDGDSDEAYCYNCYTASNKERCLHDYGYKPEPIFYGEGIRYFGMELEIDYGGKDNENARKLCEVANEDCENIYIKTDGSLDEGIEIVTNPMTLEYHRAQMPWLAVIQKALDLGYKSHKTGTCGLHIHVNRTSLGECLSQQEDTISKILFFVEKFWDELLRFSRRTEYQMNRWASRYGFKEKPKQVLDNAKKSGLGRYTCVNITNYSTIEFRMF